MMINIDVDDIGVASYDGVMSASCSKSTCPDLEGDFRRVLGHFPTGVVAITAFDGEPVGVTVGSFSSISLHPALVGFFIAQSSTTFPRIHNAGSFAVNVLSQDQSDICALLGNKDIDRFARLDWDPGHGGAPLLADALAWIECDIADLTVVGDHLLVVGAVQRLSAVDTHGPLIFFGGDYHSLRRYS